MKSTKYPIGLVSLPKKFSETAFKFNKRSRHHTQLIPFQQNRHYTGGLSKLPWPRFSARNGLSESHVRFQHAESGKNSSNNSKPFRNTLLYTASIAVGALLGVSTGEYFLQTHSPSTDETRKKYTKFLKKKKVFRPDSKYADFPFTINLYQYHSCPYCSQIRTYLDYFGFNYNIIEVDSYSKDVLYKFTQARELPILVLKDKKTESQWHLTNATAILSAMESLRNTEYQQHNSILVKYLPTLVGSQLYYLKNPFKYHVQNSELNSIEWRRWVNNQAVPVFRQMSVSSIKLLFETFDLYSKKSEWALRYSPFKMYFVYYNNAFWTYYRLTLFNGKKSNMNPDVVLDSMISEWEEALGESRFIDGNEYPNIADLILFGTATSFDGLSFFSALLLKHPKFKDWYENMREVVKNGSDKQSTKLVQPVKEFFSIETQTHKETDTPSNEQNINSQETSIKKIELNANDSNSLRILSLTYMIHVLAFTLTAWYGR